MVGQKLENSKYQAIMKGVSVFTGVLTVLYGVLVYAFWEIDGPIQFMLNLYIM